MLATVENTFSWRQSAQLEARSDPTPRLTLLDRALPYWHARRVEIKVVNAPASVAYQAALDTNFVDAVRMSFAVRTLFAVRATLERAFALLRGRPSGSQATSPSTVIRVSDLPRRGEWVLLGQQEPNEVAFGAIGRFWAGETKWMTIDAAEFAAFDDPGFAKVACNFRFLPLSASQTLVKYEVCTRATDEESRDAFLRYWHVASPLIGVVMRSMLATIERNATNLDA